MDKRDQLQLCAILTQDATRSARKIPDAANPKTACLMTYVIRNNKNEILP